MKWVWIGVAVLAAAGVGAQEPGEKWVKRFTIEVKETAGIRRNGYPVHALLTLAKPLANRSEEGRFRLRDQGKEMPADFMIAADNNRQVRVAFHSSHAPLEKRSYTVEYDPGGAMQDPLQKGLSIVFAGLYQTIQHPSGLRLSFLPDLRGLLQKVSTNATEYLRPNSTGLFLRPKRNGQDRIVVGGPQYVSDGWLGQPRISTLNYRGNQTLQEEKLDTRLTLEFPLSRSWVRVDLTVNDPKGLVEALGVEQLLNIQGEPALVDFGAGTAVYTTLKKGQSAVLRSGPLENKGSGWQVLVGPAKAPQPFVVMPPDRPSKAEGWAHVMDRQRCTAVAVADFAQDRLRSEIAVDADGRLRCEREFDAKTARKTLTFWLHFVNMPVQIGAATSPQSMMNPLHVTVRPK